MKFRQPYILLLVTSLLLSFFVYSVFSIDETFVLNQHTQLANKAVDAKINHPLTHTTIDTSKEINGIELHFANAEYRLLLPAFANILTINCSKLISIQFYLLPFFIFFITLFLFKETSDILLSVAISSTFISSYIYVCFLHHFPFFDGYALLMMSILLLIRNKYLLFILLLMSFFLDERMLLNSFLIILLRVYLQTKKITCRNIISFILQNKLFLYAWIIYLLLRLVLIFTCNFYVSPASYLFFNKTAIINNIRGGILAFFYTYKLWCVILLFNLYIAIKTEKYELYIILFGLILFIIASGIFMFDFSRIQLYLLPFMLLNIFLFSSYFTNKKTIRYLILIIFLINLVLPSAIVYGGLKNKTQNIIAIWSK